MRPHGLARIDPRNPEALAICQRCGFLYNHNKLRWQFQYGGLRLINLRILVCQSCYDEPQIQLRTIIIPQDPVPIEFPVPEDYAGADDGVGTNLVTTSTGVTNPSRPAGGLGSIGFVARDMTTIVPSTYGGMIGNLTEVGGLNAAFDANTNKPSWRSAVKSVSISSYQNTIGKWWNAQGLSPPNPASVIQTPVAYQVTSFTVSAPSDQPLLSTGATGLQLQGSNNGATWTTLYSTTTLGTNGEQIASISSNIASGNYSYHEIVIQGDGVGRVAVAQVQFSVATTGQNEQ